MSKRVLSALLVLGLVISAASCAKPDKEDSVSETTTVAEESESETIKEETEKTEETKPETEATTTTSETEASDETSSDSDKIPADEVPIREPEPKSYDNVANVTYLDAVPEDTTGLTEGPKEYHYGMGTIYVKYNGSDAFPSGVLIVSNVRCIVSYSPSPSDDLYYWLIDDDWALNEAIKQFCVDNGINESDLGLITTKNIQSITDEYYSSLRYVSANTWEAHKEDGDEYAI